MKEEKEHISVVVVVHKEERQKKNIDACSSSSSTLLSEIYIREYFSEGLPFPHRPLASFLSHDIVSLVF